jgi:hypothetical protein
MIKEKYKEVKIFLTFGHIKIIINVLNNKVPK